MIGTKPEDKSITSGDVTSGQSEGLSVVLLQLIYLSTWSVCTLGEAHV